MSELDGEVGWSRAPAEVLCAVLALVSARDLLACSGVCSRWRAVAEHAALWRRLLERDLAADPRALSVLAHEARDRPQAARAEYIRCVTPWRVTVRDAHDAPLTHVALSHDAALCCTSSRDGTFAIWEKSKEEWCVSWKCEVRSLGWWHPLHARFASGGDAHRLLLVCGALRTDAAGLRGELAVYRLTDDGPCLRSRVSLCPVSARGAWWNETCVLSADLHALGRGASCCALWLSAADQRVHSELAPVVAPLCRLYNDVGSAARLLEVCDVSARADCAGDTLVELWEGAGGARGEELYYREGREGRGGRGLRLLLYSCGLESAASHALCFTYVSPSAWPPVTARTSDRIRARRETRARRAREGEEEADVRALCTSPDRVLDLRGHVVGLTVAPEGRAVYVCVHVWRGELVEDAVSACVVSPSVLRVTWRARPPRPPGLLSRDVASRSLHYVCPALSDDYFATPAGAGGPQVWVWSRATGALLREVTLSAAAHSLALVGTERALTLLCAADVAGLTVCEIISRAPESDSERSGARPSDRVPPDVH